MVTSSKQKVRENRDRTCHGIMFLCRQLMNYDIKHICIKSGFAFSALMLLVGRQEGHPACKKRVVGCWRGYLSGVRSDLHMAQLMPLPLTVSCFSKIQIGFTFLVSAHPGSPGKGPLNVCVCVCVCIKSGLMCLLFCQCIDWLVFSLQ